MSSTSNSERLNSLVNVIQDIWPYVVTYSFTEYSNKFAGISEIVKFAQDLSRYYKWEGNGEIEYKIYIRRTNKLIFKGTAKAMCMGLKDRI